MAAPWNVGSAGEIEGILWLRREFNEDEEYLLASWSADEAPASRPGAVPLDVASQKGVLHAAVDLTRTLTADYLRTEPASNVLSLHYSNTDSDERVSAYIALTRGTLLCVCLRGCVNVHVAVAACVFAFEALAATVGANVDDCVWMRTLAEPLPARIQQSDAGDAAQGHATSDVRWPQRGAFARACATSQLRPLFACVSACWRRTHLPTFEPYDVDPRRAAHMEMDAGEGEIDAARRAAVQNELDLVAVSLSVCASVLSRTHTHTHAEPHARGHAEVTPTRVRPEHAPAAGSPAEPAATRPSALSAARCVLLGAIAVEASPMKLYFNSDAHDTLPTLAPLAMAAHVTAVESQPTPLDPRCTSHMVALPGSDASCHATLMPGAAPWLAHAPIGDDGTLSAKSETRVYPSFIHATGRDEDLWTPELRDSVPLLAPWDTYMTAENMLEFERALAADTEASVTPGGGVSRAAPLNPRHFGVCPFLVVVTRTDAAPHRSVAACFAMQAATQTAAAAAVAAVAELARVGTAPLNDPIAARTLSVLHDAVTSLKRSVLSG